MESAFTSDFSIDSTSRLPAPVLRPLISHYAGSRVEGAKPGVTRGLPSRYVDLMISLDEPFEIRGMNPVRWFIGGLRDTPAIVERRPTIDCIHLFLNPLGIRTLFGFPCAELLDRVVNLGDIRGTFCDEFYDRLRAAPNWHSRFDLLDEMFLSTFRDLSVDGRMQWAWDALISAEGNIQVLTMAGKLGWSRRYFSEKFKHEFGISPKTAVRVMRFERACAAIKRRRGSLADIAAAVGYYDQAHLSREWQMLAGCSPTTWISEQLPFLQDYEIAALHNSWE